MEGISGPPPVKVRCGDFSLMWIFSRGPDDPTPDLKPTIRVRKRFSIFRLREENRSRVRLM
jgi:hypothetical protein